MYINKKSEKRMKKSYYSFIPAVCLSLFLVFTVAILTGMCSIFPKVTAIVYDEGEAIGELNLTWERNKSDVNLYRGYVKKILEDKHLERLDDLDVVELDENDENVDFIIKRAFDVKCRIFGEEKVLSASQGETIESLLKRNGIKEQEGIFSSPPMEATIEKTKEDEDEVRVIVDKFEKEVVEEKEETIPFAIKEEQDDSLKNNERKLKQKGENGVKKVFRINGYMNGELKEEITKEEVIKPVVDEIYLVKKPTPKKVEKTNESKPPAKPPLPQSPPVEKKEKIEKPKPQPKDSKNNIVKESPAAPPGNLPMGKVVKVLQGPATAYVAKGYTSKMGPARYGVVAANPKEIPYGTRLYVVGYGECVVGDMCGAACKAAACKRKVLLDLCFNTEAECKAFGRRNVTVYVLEGSAKVNASNVANNATNNAHKTKKARQGVSRKSIRNANKAKAKNKVKT